MVLAGCAGKIDVIRPTTQIDPKANSVVVDKPRDAVWNAMVPALGKQFYVINNLDKSSGLVNVSYNGNPERYVDCGILKSYVKNARGERTYEFPGSREFVEYEVMDNGTLTRVARRTSVEGRMNIIFEEVTPSQTRVTVNTRYVLTRTAQVVSATGQALPGGSDTISFNSGAGAAFPKRGTAQAVECVPTGALERDVLALIQ